MRKKILQIFLIVNSIILLFAMESDKSLVNRTDDIKNDTVCLLMQLPIEIIQLIGFHYMNLSTCEAEAIANFRKFAWIIIHADKENPVDLIGCKKSKEYYINFFARHLNINPFFVATILKVELSNALREKLKRGAIEKELEKHKLTHDQLDEWLKKNYVHIENTERAKEIFLNLIIPAQSGPIIGVLALVKNINPDMFFNMAYRSTVLMWSAKYGHKDRVEMLLNVGANPNHQDACQYTALMFAVNREYVEIVELLLKAGCNPNTKNKWDGSALIGAASKGNKKIIQLLLNSKPDLNIRDGNGDTPLICAARKGNKHAVKLLLEAGADCNIKGQNSRKACMWAKINGHDDIVKLLVSFQKK